MDPEFSVEPHVDYYRNAGGDVVTYSNEDDLLTIIDDIVNSPKLFERATCSPWKIFVVRRSDGLQSLILVKADHALFDAGAASMVLLPVITDGVAAAEHFLNLTKVPLWVRFWYHFRGLMILPFGTLMQAFSKQDNNPIHR
jgi:hypothetical protein